MANTWDSDDLDGIEFHSVQRDLVDDNVWLFTLACHDADAVRALLERWGPT